MRVKCILFTVGYIILGGNARVYFDVKLKYLYLFTFGGATLADSDGGPGSPGPLFENFSLGSDVQYIYMYVCTHACAVHTDRDKYFEILT